MQAPAAPVAQTTLPKPLAQAQPQAVPSPAPPVQTAQLTTTPIASVAPVAVAPIPQTK
jgi:hypothetical protein